MRQIGVTEQTGYRWRKKYDGMGQEQVKGLKRLQSEAFSPPLVRGECRTTRGSDALCLIQRSTSSSYRRQPGEFEAVHAGMDDPVDRPSAQAGEARESRSQQAGHRSSAKEAWF